MLIVVTEVVIILKFAGTVLLKCHQEFMQKVPFKNCLMIQLLQLGRV